MPGTKRRTTSACHRKASRQVAIKVGSSCLPLPATATPASALGIAHQDSWIFQARGRRDRRKVVCASHALGSPLVGASKVVPIVARLDTLPKITQMSVTMCRTLAIQVLVAAVLFV